MLISFFIQNEMSKYEQVFAFCKKHGLDYKDVVSQFTNGRTDSLRALSDAEYLHLCIGLNRSSPGKWEPKPGDKVRKKMIAIARQMHWGTAGSNFHLLAKLDAWCLKQKYGKRLNDLSVEELGVMATVFEKNVYGDYLKGLNR